MLLNPELRRQKQIELWVGIQTSLQSEFQAIQDYIVSQLCLKKKIQES